MRTTYVYMHIGSYKKIVTSEYLRCFTCDSFKYYIYTYDVIYIYVYDIHIYVGVPEILRHIPKEPDHEPGSCQCCSGLSPNAWGNWRPRPPSATSIVQMLFWSKHDMDTIESQKIGCFDQKNIFSDLFFESQKKNIFSDLSLTITFSDFFLEHFCIFPERVVSPSQTTGSRPSTAGSAAGTGAGGAGGTGAGGGSRCAGAGGGVLGAGSGWNGGAGHDFFGGIVGGWLGGWMVVDSWKWGKFVDKRSFSACRFFKMWDQLCLLFLICSLGSAECQARPPLGASLVSAPLRVFILYV